MQDHESLRKSARVHCDWTHKDVLACAWIRRCVSNHTRCQLEGYRDCLQPPLSLCQSAGGSEYEGRTSQIGISSAGNTDSTDQNWSAQLPSTPITLYFCVSQLQRDVSLPHDYR